MKLTSINTVQEIMERHGLQFNKGFGQNFLINDAIPKRIAGECGAGPEDGILEIGPGIGTLTCELCQRYRKVVAVEVDPHLIPALGETLAEFDNVTVINADILKTDLKALLAEQFPGMSVTVCANLPYYITTPIIMGLLESGCHFDHLTVMVQKEVAARLCSLPGDSEYGAVTASVLRYGSVERLFQVSAGSFLPAPKVDSTVIRISIDKERRYSVKSEALMGRTIRGAFAQRRKNLCNSLASEFSEIPKARIADLLHDLGFPDGIRGERLDTAAFARLADGLYPFAARKDP